MDKSDLSRGLTVYTDNAPVIVPHWYMYPPKGAYQLCDDDSALREELGKLAGTASVYVHIPFCAMHCTFCTLYASAGGSARDIDRYIDCLTEEISLVADVID